MPLPIIVINSNLSPLSHRFRDMASFPLKMHIFPTPLFNPNIENVSLALHPQILYVESLNTGNY